MLAIAKLDIGGPRGPILYLPRKKGSSSNTPNRYYGIPKGFGANCYAFAKKCARMIRDREISE